MCRCGHVWVSVWGCGGISHVAGRGGDGREKRRGRGRQQEEIGCWARVRVRQEKMSANVIFFYVGTQMT